MNVPTLRVDGEWESLLTTRQRAKLERALPAWLAAQRWFAGKGRPIRSVKIAGAPVMPASAGRAVVALLEVTQPHAKPATYAAPLAFAAGAGAARIAAKFPASVIARIESECVGSSGIVFDATADAAFASALLDAMRHHRTFDGADGARIECSSSAALAESGGSGGRAHAPRLSTAEQSNTTIRFGRRFVLKLFRRPMPGINPDLEMGRMLTARRFPNTPPLLGAIEHRAADGATRTLGVLHRFIPGATDGWEFTLDELARFFDRTRNLGDPPHPSPPRIAFEKLIKRPPGASARDILGDLFDASILLGERIAELHAALAAMSDNPGFTPEPFGVASMRDLSKSFLKSAAAVLGQLASRATSLAPKTRRLALGILAKRKRIVARFRRVATLRPSGGRIRIHGDLHFGQALRTESDFFIIDFEGEPSAPLDERRRKQSPLHDVAGMLRSFDYAVNAALRRTVSENAATAAEVRNLRRWADQAAAWMSGNFLAAYHAHSGIARLPPASIVDDEPLLWALLLRKALYEVAYELNNRPDWLEIPCRAVLTMLDGEW